VNPQQMIKGMKKRHHLIHHLAKAVAQAKTKMMGKGRLNRRKW
jgi:hypothetical protein